MAKVERTTTLEVDEAILDKHEKKSSILSANELYAVVYRSEMKRTMRAQLEIIKFVRQILDKSYEIPEKMAAGSAEAEVAKMFRYSYLQKMEDEIKDCEDKGQFQNEEAEYWYQYRRLQLRHYFEAIWVLQSGAHREETNPKPEVKERK